MNKKKLRLPNVTLVMFENMEHELARLAVQDCFDVADFGDALILTDKPECFPFKDCRFPKVSWSGKMGWARSVWFDLPPLVHTSHMLLLQWDAWIWDASKWQDRFLDYDLIGAPWWYTDGKNVGNTGFALKTTALARYIRDHRDKFPCNTGTEDDLLCRTYRPELERLGFTWAPEKLAHEFARECAPPTPDHRAFGFHGAFNFHHVLPHDRLLERARLMFASPYLTAGSGSYILKNFCEQNPAIVKEVLDEESRVQPLLT